MGERYINRESLTFRLKLTRLYDGGNGLKYHLTINFEEGDSLRGSFKPIHRRPPIPAFAIGEYQVYIADRTLLAVFLQTIRSGQYGFCSVIS